MADLVMPELVDCPPMRSRMTERACVRMWSSTQEKPPELHEARTACLTCPLGAQRAGIDVAIAERLAHAAALADVMRHHCPRCSRKAARLINGRFCISCYNRDREARIGRNAKGTPPTITATIHAKKVAVTLPSSTPRIVAIERVVSRMEALVVAARQAGPGALIGVPPLEVPGAPDSAAA
ncbi:hypothetical protein [Neoroseomonas rubea]|uniref:hypothetical protein n=1 Tax=Neoroseomonas rubea TaxID=2748666 RepID=UPI0018DFD219|nr:hypothetical protein [Roseomonas rubea]